MASREESKDPINLVNDIKGVFVARLPPDISKDELSAYFEKFGKILRIIIPISKKHKTRGIAFIEFEDQSGRDSSLSFGKHRIRGQEIIVDEVLELKKAKAQAEKVQSLKIFVKGLPLDSKKNEIVEFFSRYGELDRVLMVSSRGRSKTFKGYCYIVFKKQEDIVRVLESDKPYVFRNRHKLDISPASTLQQVFIQRRSEQLEAKFQARIKKRSSKFGRKNKNNYSNSDLVQNQSPWSRRKHKYIKTLVESRFDSPNKMGYTHSSKRVSRYQGLPKTGFYLNANKQQKQRNTQKKVEQKTSNQVPKFVRKPTSLNLEKLKKQTWLFSQFHRESQEVRNVHNNLVHVGYRFSNLRIIQSRFGNIEANVEFCFEKFNHKKSRTEMKLVKILLILPKMIDTEHFREFCFLEKRKFINVLKKQSSKGIWLPVNQIKEVTFQDKARFG